LRSNAPTGSHFGHRLGLPREYGDALSVVVRDPLRDLLRQRAALATETVDLGDHCFDLGQSIGLGSSQQPIPYPRRQTIPCSRGYAPSRGWAGTLMGVRMNWTPR
jgi:hypothetical protein